MAARRMRSINDPAQTGKPGRGNGQSATLLHGTIFLVATSPFADCCTLVLLHQLRDSYKVAT
jgi:hypothetical protein